MSSPNDQASLLKYSKTKFASNFLMLGNLSTCSGALRGLFFSDEFSHILKSTKRIEQECKAKANDAAWWEKVKSMNIMIKLVMDLLQVVDSLLSISKVYKAMD